jgi:hypothetical protein
MECAGLYLSEHDDLATTVLVDEKSGGSFLLRDNRKVEYATVELDRLFQVGHIEYQGLNAQVHLALVFWSKTPRSGGGLRAHAAQPWAA